jgi:hypothetical protein
MNLHKIREISLDQKKSKSKTGKGRETGRKRS